MDEDVVRGPAAVIFNDMIKSNLRTPEDPNRTAQIAGSGLIEASAACVDAARRHGVPIFWIQVARRPDRSDVFDALVDRHFRGATGPRPPVVAGTQAAANIDELPVQPDDRVILKPRMDPFIGTDLDVLLRTLKVQTVLLGGYSTNGGVESCARSARDLNYDVVVMSDCCYNVDEQDHEYTLTRILPYYGRVRSLEQVTEMMRQGSTRP